MRAHMWLVYASLSVCIVAAHYVLYLLIRFALLYLLSLLAGFLLFTGCARGSVLWSLKFFLSSFCTPALVIVAVHCRLAFLACSLLRTLAKQKSLIAKRRAGISAADDPLPPSVQRRQRHAEVWPAFFQDTVLRP